jgi:hypothetical protein
VPGYPQRRAAHAQAVITCCYLIDGEAAWEAELVARTVCRVSAHQCANVVELGTRSRQAQCPGSIADSNGATVSGYDESAGGDLMRLTGTVALQAMWLLIGEQFPFDLKPLVSEIPEAAKTKNLAKSCISVPDHGPTASILK